NTQSLSAQASLSDIVYDGMAANKIDLSMAVPDVTQAIPDNLTLDATNFRINPHIRFDTLQANLAPRNDYYHLAVSANGQSRFPFSIKAETDIYDLLTDMSA